MTGKELPPAPVRPKGFSRLLGMETVPINLVRHKLVAHYGSLYVALYRAEDGTYIAEVVHTGAGWYSVYYRLRPDDVKLFETKRANFDATRVPKLSRMKDSGITGVRRDGEDILVPLES